MCEVWRWESNLASWRQFDSPLSAAGQCIRLSQHARRGLSAGRSKEVTSFESTQTEARTIIIGGHS